MKNKILVIMRAQMKYKAFSTFYLQHNGNYLHNVFYVVAAL